MQKKQPLLFYSILTLWLFQVSGAIGIVTGYQDWFLSLTPLNLSLYLIAVLLNIPPLTLRMSLIITLPFFIGMLAEWLGVQWGLIFGDYHYGRNLGWKVGGVPITIGFNWVVLTYAAASVSKKWVKNIWFSSAFAALLMVAIDVLIEPNAPRFDFWHWDIGYAPLQNYVGWFAVALLAQLSFQSLWDSQNYRFMLSVHILLSIAFFFGIFLII